MAIDFEDAAHGLEADNNCGIVARLLVGESDEEEEEEEEEEEGDGFDAFIGLKPAVAGGCEVLFGEHFGLVGVYLFNTSTPTSKATSLETPAFDLPGILQAVKSDVLTCQRAAFPLDAWVQLPPWI
ncbi:hypothetical protein NEUTE1DRAFT_134855 [Neurospora tetrasperma FGSC 2508]|uniref:Uncharacterized protein n=1 Tax=Neurospora tetrasperma (strain FGSC 2508 / ATCC MYA-4615 / P0657) TaxID=510951 RepID=F8MET9_NEUT8|nr:uncharacterized protein NEUTE1DRAFT_134855 [Neurospora tetrasperma FGSC 2508]EGO60863.1 hypothetical protein NEUTE1DRAFT_134855 [Neurospora tetrasperma FGSC 2508]